MLHSLVHITNKKQLFPFYHLVSNNTPNFIKHLYTPKTENEFKQDLSVFLQYFESISLSQTIETKNFHFNNKKPSFHVTFDDGLSNFYHVIAPILLKRKIHATVFLNTDFIDNKDLFYRYKASLLIEKYNTSDKEKKIKMENFVAQQTNGIQKNVKDFLLEVNYQNKQVLNELANEINFSFSVFLQKEQPYLTTTQIKELQEQGFTFGSHSVNHPLYQKLPLEQQIKQTIESIDFLQKKFQIKHCAFAFPFYDTGITTDFFNKIKHKIEISFGTSGIKEDAIPFNLQRLDMEKNLGNTKTYLIKNYLKFVLQKPLNKHLMKRN